MSVQRRESRLGIEVAEVRSRPDSRGLVQRTDAAPRRLHVIVTVVIDELLFDSRRQKRWRGSTRALTEVCTRGLHPMSARPPVSVPVPDERDVVCQSRADNQRATRVRTPSSAGHALARTRRSTPVDRKMADADGPQALGTGLTHPARSRVPVSCSPATRRLRGSPGGPRRSSSRATRSHDATRPRDRPVPSTAPPRCHLTPHDHARRLSELEAQRSRTRVTDSLIVTFSRGNYPSEKASRTCIRKC